MAWNLIFKDATLFTCANSNADQPITGLTLFFNDQGKLLANVDINLKSEKNIKALDGFSYFRPRVYSSDDKILKLEFSDIEERNILIGMIDSIAPFGDFLNDITKFINSGMAKLNSWNKSYAIMLTALISDSASDMEMASDNFQNSNSNVTNNTNKSFAKPQMDDLPGYMSDDESSKDEAFYDEDEELARALAETKLDSKEEVKTYSPRR